ncbi:hypothetical protein ACO0K7_15330 [Undibacterium sp. Ji67W]|uniref:hypothetical protein n=1 Tax=Undibacterium sp. Ji67W TaxID=3413042 RepID=UPI003BF16DBB
MTRQFKQCLSVLLLLLISVPGLALAQLTTVNSGKLAIALHINETFKINVAGICDQFPATQIGQLNLRINGQLMPLKASDCDSDPNQYGLDYFLPQPDTTDLARLRDVLSGSPWRDARHGFQRELSYTVSFNDSRGENQIAAGTMHYQIIRIPYLLIGFVFIAIVSVALIRLAKASTLLRDTPSGPCSIPVLSRTYSMGRVQMAWWFFIVLISYIWLWIVAEGIPAMSVQALGLMGIGSATYLTAAGVDASKQNVLGNSQGFWNDILSDAQGLALYRFQMLVFNVLFGVLFLIYVLQNVTMPELDTNILALLGMSAGTYAGFKIPEKQNVATSPAPDQQNDPKQAYGEQT